MKVLLTGGAGYIGSNVLLALRDSGYETLILDNFCNSSEERLKTFAKLLGGNLNYVKSDIRSIQELRKVFSQHEIESVIHLAGLKSVSESIENPNPSNLEPLPPRAVKPYREHISMAVWLRGLRSHSSIF